MLILSDNSTYESEIDNSMDFTTPYEGVKILKSKEKLNNSIIKVAASSNPTFKSDEHVPKSQHGDKIKEVSSNRANEGNNRSLEYHEAWNYPMQSSNELVLKPRSSSS